LAKLRLPPHGSSAYRIKSFATGRFIPDAHLAGCGATTLPVDLETNELRELRFDDFAIRVSS
jgi:hypothetical protein